MRSIELGWARLVRTLKNAGPYVLLELILPGGTLFALLLYVYRTGAFAALQPMPMVCNETPRYFSAVSACREQTCAALRGAYVLPDCSPAVR